MASETYWYQGARLEPGDFSLNRIFIYHVPRTGTSTLYTALRTSADKLFWIMKQGIPGFAAPRIARFDSPDDPARSAIEGDFLLVASHNQYGFHERFDHGFELVTILRDPASRVLSLFAYSRMRSGEPAGDGDAFEAFYRAERNRDVAVKQLAGAAWDAPATTADLERAKRHLVNDFHLYGTTAHIGAICSALLYANRMPNVWTDRINATRPEFRFDGERFRDTVAEHNALDAELFAFVAESPRLPPQSPPREPSQLTVLVRQDLNAEIAGGRTLSLPTEAIRDRIATGNFPKSAMDAFFDESVSQS